MNKVAILSDSTCDLSKELLEQYNIDAIPLHVSFDEESYKDGVDITLEELYNKAEKLGKLPKTSAPSQGEMTAFFKKYLDEGYDIVFTGISSKMSATYQIACLVKQELAPDRIFVVDSGNLSTGIGLLLLKATKFRVKAQFVIDTLDYLYKGGRCSTVSYAFSKVLRIKPMIVVREKAMQVGTKFVGSITRAQAGMTKMFLNDFEKIDKEFVFITHTMAYEGAKYIRNMISNVSPQIENLYETVAGCVIGSHCGRNTIGILYIMKDEIVAKVDNIAE